MTTVVLIKAGPTPWDAEKRISGNLTLPLTEDGRAKMLVMLDSLPRVDAIYCCKHNEACDQVAKMIGTLRKLKIRDNANLDAWCLGLWQGLRMDDLRQRYRTALEQWEQSPQQVVPPEGEAFSEAIDRLRRAIRKIVRRNRGRAIAIIARPSAMQILAGVLFRESPEQIARRLQNDATMETIEVTDEVIKEL